MTMNNIDRLSLIISSYLMCHIDDVLQQTSNVDHTLQANAFSGKCPINSIATARGITRHATKQSVNASDVKK